MSQFQVGDNVLRYRDHHDKNPTTETVKRVTSRTVTLTSGEKFGIDGVAWGKSKDWFAPHIDAKRVADAEAQEATQRLSAASTRER